MSATSITMCLPRLAAVGQAFGEEGLRLEALTEGYDQLSEVVLRRVPAKRT